MRRIAMALVAMGMATWVHAAGGDLLENASAAVQVVDAQLRTAEAPRGAGVTVLGELKNVTAIPVSDLVVEAKLLDAQDQLVDVLTEPVYGIVVMPGEQVAFRIHGLGTATRASYAKVQARVTSGETLRPVKAKAAAPAGWYQRWGKNLLFSWGPMVLLLAVWFALMRYGAGRKSPTNRTMDLMAEQVAQFQRQIDVLGEQNALMARQAVALETLAQHTGAGRQS